MKTIVLCGGGTAGHVMPNLALLPKLKKEFDKIYYIGSFNGIENEIIKQHPEIEYYPITTVKLIRSLTIKNLTIPFKLFKGYFEAKKLLEKLKPTVVFSKGGYVSVPVTFAAKKLKIPVIAHESDFNLGLANKLILKTCKKMCCSFEETAKNLGNKGVFTLSPIREELFLGNRQTAFKSCKFTALKPTILVIGGSLGATAINEIIFKTAEKLIKKYNIIHIVGKGNLNKKIKLNNYFQIEFTPNIENFFALADMVISRAGSNTINEFLVLNKPMLLIPLPKGNSRGDQILNAESFTKKGFALTLNQENLTETNLLKKITELEISTNKIKENQKPYFHKNGTTAVLNVILNCINEK